MGQKIWHCEACGADYLAPKYRKHTETHNELDGDFAEVSFEAYCPECGSSDVDWNWACEACGSHPMAGGSDYCVTCQALMDEVMDSACARLGELFDKDSWNEIEGMIEEYMQRKDEE